MSEDLQQQTVPSHWTMKDVQEKLYSILQADHPLSQDQRRALKGVIEMCDIWAKISPHFAKVVKEIEERVDKRNTLAIGGPSSK